MAITEKLLLILESLTHSERVELIAHLVRQIKEIDPDGKIDLIIFRAVLSRFPSLPIELMVLDDEIVSSSSTGKMMNMMDSIYPGRSFAITKLCHRP